MSGGVIRGKRLAAARAITICATEKLALRKVTKWLLEALEESNRLHEYFKRENRKLFFVSCFSRKTLRATQVGAEWKIAMQKSDRFAFLFAFHDSRSSPRN
jgi:hypothetical protein